MYMDGGTETATWRVLNKLMAVISPEGRLEFCKALSDERLQREIWEATRQAFIDKDLKRFHTLALEFIEWEKLKRQFCGYL
jgi:hypothetical protein